MKAGWIPITCGALVVASLVLVVLNIQPPGRELPDLTVRDSSGRGFEVATLGNTVWIASFISRRCLDACPGALDRLAALHDEMPEGMTLVTFVLDSEGQWPPRPAAARERQRWVVAQGNDVDADPESALRAFAADHLRIDPARLAALRTRSPAAIAVTVDRLGRPRRVREVVEAEAATGRSLRAVVGDAFFLVALDRRPALHALLNAATAALLLTGLVFIRRKLVRAHLTCMIAAVAVTVVFLVSYLVYHFNVGSIPFRGTGWSRPLYFGVLLSHAVLAAVIVPLAARMLWFAYRKEFERHKALGRFALPVWLYVSCTGVLVYCMLYLWFPAPSG